MSKIDFRNIFYSNSRLNIGLYNLEEVTLMLEENLIGFNKIQIAKNSDFQEAIEFVVDPSNGFVFGGESAMHSALKYLAYKFLIFRYSLNARDVLFEQVFSGFEVDVVDKSLRFPCECGDTNAAKLEQYLIFPSVQKFYVLPYPHTKSVAAFEFFAKPDFWEYIKFKKDYFNKQRVKIVR